eukprot:2934841-Ditylum_brightwellii.AAC.1
MGDDSVKIFENDDSSEASSWVKGHKEYGLMGKEAQLTFNNNAKILEDPNVFIGDTRATNDTTNSQFDFENIRKANAGDDIVDVSGNGLADSIVGELSKIICDKRGKEICEATIKDVVHMPNAGYNLFSLTKRLEQGWALGGGSSTIWITKGNAKITFNIKIKTPKGVIFAIYFKRK